MMSDILINIDSAVDMGPNRYQAITWTNADLSWQLDPQKQSPVKSKC